MSDLLPISLGNIMYLEPSGNIKFSIAFEMWIFDYLDIDLTNNKIK